MQSHQFFRVGRMIPMDQDLVTVSPSTRVADALSLMREHNFDQLPVMAAGRVVGVFSTRSLARGLSTIHPQEDPLSAPVEDLLEDLAFVRTTDEVNLVLAHLDRDGAVLVGDEEKLLAVATDTDITAYLWNATHPFVLLQDIELAVRDLMRSSCTDPEMRVCIAVAFHSESAKGEAKLEDLTLGETMGVLLKPQNFGSFFRTRFGKNRDLVSSTLEPVRLIRNKVFHFRDDVTPEELETLVDTGRWLRRKILMRAEKST